MRSQGPKLHSPVAMETMAATTTSYGCKLEARIFLPETANQQESSAPWPPHPRPRNTWKRHCIKWSLTPQSTSWIKSTITTTLSRTWASNFSIKMIWRGCTQNRTCATHRHTSTLEASSGQVTERCSMALGRKRKTRRAAASTSSHSSWIY